MYVIEFAPDGEHYHATNKIKNCQKAWEKFMGDVEIRQQIAINPYARFRLLLDDKVLAELPIGGNYGAN